MRSIDGRPSVLLSKKMESIDVMEFKGHWRSYPISTSMIAASLLNNRIRLAAGGTRHVWLTVEQQQHGAMDGGFASSSQTVGVLLFEDGLWSFHTLEGLPRLEHQIFEIACDRNGRLWLYDAPDVISSFDGQEHMLFQGGEQGLPDDLSYIAGLVTNPFAFDGSGNTWLALGTAGLHRYDGQEWSSFPIEGFVQGQASVEKVAAQEGGRIWFVLHDSDRLHFVRCEGQRCEVITTLPTQEDYPGISTLAVDHKGCIWLGWQFVYQGLWKYDPSTQMWERYTQRNSALQSNDVRSITVDNQDRIWVGNATGVTVFAGNESVCWQALMPTGPLTLPPPTTPAKIKAREQKIREVRDLSKTTEADACIFVQGELATDEFGEVWIMSHSGVCGYSEPN